MKYYSVKINDKGNIAVDDMLLVKGYEAKAGSRILEGFKPLFSAEAVTRLEEKGYVISGKTEVGEFSLDLAGELSGSPLSAAALVKNGEVKAALGVDMNGSPRRSAAAQDTLFIKPTYGTVSRYGVISTAASGEAVGVYADSPEIAREILSVIAGHDEKDGTSLKNESYSYEKTDVKGKKVRVVKELFEKADDEVKGKVKAFADSLREKGVEVEEISLDIFETANIAYTILSSAETCNNLSRYDGVKYGYRTKEYKNIDELYSKSRSECFNFLTKTVILYGSDVLSKNRYKDCYDKSLRIRRVVAEKIKEVFGSCDALLTPVMSKTAVEEYDIKDAFEKVAEESVFTSVANLVGCPALAVSGVQLIGKHFDEKTLLSLAERKGE